MSKNLTGPTTGKRETHVQNWSKLDNSIHKERCDCFRNKMWNEHLTFRLTIQKLSILTPKCKRWLNQFHVSRQFLLQLSFYLTSSVIILRLLCLCFTARQLLYCCLSFISEGNAYYYYSYLHFLDGLYIHQRN